MKTTVHREKHGCGVCRDEGRLARRTDFFTQYPIIMSEFDLDANKSTRFTWRDAVWFRCKAAGHLQQRRVQTRRTARGCTDCGKDKRIASGLEDGTF